MISGFLNDSILSEQRSKSNQTSATPKSYSTVSTFFERTKALFRNDQGEKKTVPLNTLLFQEQQQTETKSVDTSFTFAKKRKASDSSLASNISTPPSSNANQNLKRSKLTPAQPTTPLFFPPQPTSIMSLSPDFEQQLSQYNQVCVLNK